MRRILFAFFLLTCSIAVHAQERMLFVEYRVVSPQLSSSSPETQSRKLWLVGTKYMRFEDVPNPQTKVHGLIIVAEPDIWVIDRNTNQGQHSKDPGPSYAVHFPMLASETSPRLKQLEFGREIEFFDSNGAKPRPPQTVDGVSCNVFGMQIDDRDLSLFLRKDNTPFQVSVKTEAYQYSLRILKYEPALEPDLSLFKPPPGVTLK